MTGTKRRETPLIVVTDPNQHVLMKVLDDYLDPGRKWSDVENTFLPPIGRIHITIKGRGLFNIYRFDFSKIISKMEFQAQKFQHGNLILNYFMSLKWIRTYVKPFKRPGD